ncbi:hypothetical protein [Bacillus thuringiensis]|uniref:hypothetical protein n=1 Tax=Bacillus cereus group TaxID=86661 RepID=UPI000368B7E7|nr:hypothetical protein [Bacillus thuringiensis]MCH5449888.1 hypothetical protein [Bacillus cereus]MCU5187766.1 hypothetical protein [Bacillus cereus]
MDQSLTRYVIRSKEEGKSEEEILKSMYKWGTQADIAKALNISIRRVKYLSNKYGLTKNESYKSTKICPVCGLETHISCFDVFWVNGKLKNKHVCYSCEREYHRSRYMHRVITEKWEQEQIKKEIFILKYKLEVLESLLR